MQSIQNGEVINTINNDTTKTTKTVEVITTNTPSVDAQPANLTSLTNYKITSTENCFANIEEQKLILHFKNGGSIEELTDEQLVILSSLYKFTTDDLIKIQHNTGFFYYLDNMKLIPFNKLPKEIKQNIEIAKLAYACGYHEFITYIPKEQQTQQICDNAFYGLLKNIGEYFCYLDDKFKTADMCRLYLRYAKKIDFSLIPTELRNELADDFIEKIKDIKFSDIKINDLQFQGTHLLAASSLQENPAIAAIACVSNVRAIKKFDTDIINDAVLQLIATKTIAYIPTNNINIELVLIRIKSASSLSKKELAIIKSYLPKHKAIIQDALLASPDKKTELFLLLTDSLTEEQCIAYCNDNPYLYTNLPEHFQANSEVIKSLLAKDPYNISIINKEYLTKEHCIKAYKNIPLQSIINATIEDINNYKSNKYNFICNVPTEYRNLDMWFYLCTNIDRKYMHYIPSELFTKEFLTKLIDEYVQWDNRFDLIFIEDLFIHKLLDDDSKNKILNHTSLCCARFSTALFSILKSTKIPETFKNQLLVNLKNGELQSPKHPIITELYNKTSPLKQVVPAIIATDFLASCYKFTNVNKKTDISTTAQSLKNYLNKELANLPLDEIDNDFSQAKVTGGRTIQVNTSESTALFYKFRKKDEPLNEFIKEGYFLEFLQVTDIGKQLRNQLWSDIPTLQKMVSIPVNLLPNCAFSCEDGFERYNNSNNVECVDVLVFAGSKDYLQYAHKVDIDNPQQPFIKSETGLLKACHDIGVFMSHGIYHTSPLPAFHYAEDNRHWIALHMLLRRLYDKPIREFPIERTDINMVGKLECWDTTATARPDYGWTGIRDLADCEFYGEIFTILTRAGCYGLKLFQSVTQNISAANATCECLLAAILLYARLHKPQDSYHYKNKDQHKKTAEFIENLFTTFLKARTHSETINLQEFMQLTKTDYTTWLDRATTELLYWTAKQTLVSFNENNSTDKPESYMYDCFANHINQGVLPKTLYNDNIVPSHITYPNFFTDTHNGDGNHLGSYNATLPLLALLNFMILLNIRLNENYYY
jgi:hypothetical protein